MIKVSLFTISSFFHDSIKEIHNINNIHDFSTFIHDLCNPFTHFKFITKS